MNSHQMASTRQSFNQHRALWLAASGILLMAAGQGVWYGWRTKPGYGALVVLAASLILLFARDSSRTKEGISPGTDSTHFRLAWRHFLIVPGIGLAVYVGWLGSQNPPPSAWSLLALWGSAILLVYAALIPIRAVRNWCKEAVYSLRSDHREWLVVFALTVLALILRMAWLNDFPDMMAEDEGYFALQAANIGQVQHWHQSPFRYDVHAHPMLFHTLLAVSITILGRTAAAARTPSALLGALTIPGVYLAGRRLMDRRVALVAAIFMTVFPLHIHFSRLALNQVMDPFCAVWLFAFLTGALIRGNKMEYGLAGVMLGLSQYGYSAARLIPLLAAFYVTWFYLFHRAAFRRHWQGILITVLIAGVIFWPQVYSLLQDQTWLLSPRLKDVGIWQQGRPGTISQQGSTASYWIRQVSNPFLGFVQHPDAGYFYCSLDPFLGWFAPVPFLIGVVLAARHGKNAGAALLIAWWVTTAIFGGVLLTNPPEYQRFVIVTPALAILVASGIVYIGDVLAALSHVLTPDQPVPHWIEYWVVPVAFVLMIGAADLRTYLVDYRAARLYFRDQRTDNLNAVANILPSLEGYQIWYFSALNLNLSTSPILRYKAPETVGTEYTGAIEALPDLVKTHPGKQAFVIAWFYPHLKEVANLLLTIPGVDAREYMNPHTDFTLVYVFKVDSR